MTDIQARSTLTGFVDAVEKSVISGWAADLANARQPVTLLLVVDSHPLAMFTCSEPRADVSARGIPGALLGFRIELPAHLNDGLAHRIAIRFRDGSPLPRLTATGESDAEIVYQYQSTEVHGVVDGIFGSAVRGWAFRTDLRTGERSAGVTLEVRSNGVRIGQVSASVNRNDVAEAHGCPPNCGFLYTPPPRFRDGKPFVLEFRAVPEQHDLDGSPFTGAILARDAVEHLQGMYAKIETLCTQLYALKHQMRDMLTQDEYTLQTYHFWAVGYFDTLRARLLGLRRGEASARLLAAGSPKVSVICPAYRPDLDDFSAAVESVLRQTWQEWELIIVDDGSRSDALTAAIARLVETDARIRAVPHASNQGISAATNTAIAAASGDYIALFDHDDLLVDTALEVMVLAALHSGARVIYSDEDKIDQFGMFSEPHLKTDWNYRLLLTNNYVCHLLMVQTATLRAAGPFNPELDGAQDHDLMLRLAETVPPSDIHHVPEILYHWRKTEGSTASQTSAKSYAVDAGRRAVAGHLERRGLRAEITTPYEATLFDVRWQHDGDPSVSILIPFKDQPETTRRCVECILKVTEYQAYEIVLIDNWSTEQGTRTWLETLRGHARVRVIRVEEAFNFSRLNNLAASQCESELLLFLNNDIFVSQPDWISLMVGEALADPRVGIVGVKLVYPNQTVQHAGVVLGVGGVADHTFRYSPRDERGYAFRAVTASDMSAVTAACMLCRADAFRAVGMFDEGRLAVAFNDVDLCLKVGRAGYRVVFTPAVVAEHHESLSRGNDLAEHNLPRFYDENQTMWDRWGELLRSDPYYSPHFSHETGMYEKLSSASLDAARAPSLLHRPVQHATLTVAPPLKISHTRPSRTPRAGENGQHPVAEGATGPRKRSGKVDRAGSRVSGKPAARRINGVAAPTE